MRKKYSILFVVLACCILLLVGKKCFHFWTGEHANDDNIGINVLNDIEKCEELLKLTGIPEEIIDYLDGDIKQFIVNDLKRSGDIENMCFLDNETDYKMLPCNMEDNEINLFMVAFRYNDNVNTYCIYEFLQTMQLSGNDSFSIQFGDAFLPYEYGGMLWCISETGMDEWEEVGELAANNQSLVGAVYSGNQMGSSDSEMIYKGCVAVHSKEGSGVDNTILVQYIHK